MLTWRICLLAWMKKKKGGLTSAYLLGRSDRVEEKRWRQTGRRKRTKEEFGEHKIEGPEWWGNRAVGGLGREQGEPRPWLREALISWLSWNGRVMDERSGWKGIECDCVSGSGRGRPRVASLSTHAIKSYAFLECHVRPMGAVGFSEICLWWSSAR